MSALLADAGSPCSTTSERRHRARPVGVARRQRVVQALAVLAIAVTGGYLTWRALATLDLEVWWVAGPLFVLELHALLTLVMLVVTAWDVTALGPPPPVSTPPGRVAVLIPTYDEPLEVLLPTVAGAVDLRVPHATVVLDDGRREWVRELAEQLGAGYLTRPDNEHAKAGNLNAALARVDAEFFAVLDADHVPAPEFLERTLGYFTDPRVALVQTPQDFYNTDSFEHVTVGVGRWLPGRWRRAGRVCSEQALFYRVLQPGRNRWNAAFWCGTGAVLRAAALRDVGGLATESVTEDIHTTIRLHRRGWRTAYHDEVLARGLAAADGAQYLSQRVRWGTGAMQVLRQERVLTGPGLTAGQRLSYLATLTGWFDAWRTLGYLLLPAVVLLTGASPIAASAATFAAVFLPALVLQQLALVALGRGHGSLGVAVLFEIVRMPANLVATLHIASSREVPFRVTAKGRQGEARHRIRVPSLHVAVTATAGLALLWWCLTRSGLTPLHYGSPWVADVSAGWLLLDLVLVAVAVHRIRSPRHATERRAAVRFPAELPATLDGRPARLLDVSVTGARVTSSTAPAPVPLVHALHVTLGGVTVGLAATARSVEESDGQWLLALEFLPDQLPARSALARALAHGGLIAAGAGGAETRGGRPDAAVGPVAPAQRRPMDPLPAAAPRR